MKRMHGIFFRRGEMEDEEKRRIRVLGHFGGNLDLTKRKQEEISPTNHYQELQRNAFWKPLST